MRYSYLVWGFLLALAGQQAQAQTTAWRPFRPGVVYSYAQSGSSTTLTLHTLRADSAYATAGGDSVYTFNRLLRHPISNSYAYQKSRNNLFGARLRWQPGSSSYYLETNAEPLLPNSATPTTLLLRPRAAVGSTWAASGTLTATLSSRAAGQVGTQPDSLATVTLSNGQVLILSKHYGLVQGPQWLALATSGTTATNWYQPDVPQPGLGAYDPRRLFAMQPGALLGYTVQTPTIFTIFTCQSGYRLRRILSRRETADSLIIRYQEQDNITSLSSTAPGCGSNGPAGTALTPVRQGVWAFSLRTGTSAQFPMLSALANELRATLPFSQSGYSYYNVAHKLAPATSTNTISYQMAVNSSGTYTPGIDMMGYWQNFTTGTGYSSGYDGIMEFSLSYYCPAGANCPPPAAYATLLPTRAAQAATIATLHPNPASEAATLTFAAPMRTAATLSLTDALGRPVWQAVLPAGQASATVPLAGRAAGLYLVHLSAPDAPPATWKLTHE